MNLWAIYSSSQDPARPLGTTQSWLFWAILTRVWIWYLFYWTCNSNQLFYHEHDWIKIFRRNHPSDYYSLPPLHRLPSRPHFRQRTRIPTCFQVPIERCVHHRIAQRKWRSLVHGKCLLLLDWRLPQLFRPLLLRARFRLLHDSWLAIENNADNGPPDSYQLSRASNRPVQTEQISILLIFHYSN